MMRAAFHALGLFLLLGFSCRADLTLRYSIDVKMGGAVPPALVETVKQQLAATLPKERMIRIKGDRTLTDLGPLTGIVDNAGAEITLLNPAAKQYARIPVVDYAAAFQSAVPISLAARQALERLKLDVQSSSTGQMAMVFGIRAEEHLTTITASMDLPGAAAQTQPVSRIEIHRGLPAPPTSTGFPDFASVPIPPSVRSPFSIPPTRSKNCSASYPAWATRFAPPRRN